MKVGDAPSCDAECDVESMEPNAKHTECGNNKLLSSEGNLSSDIYRNKI